MEEQLKYSPRHPGSQKLYKITHEPIPGSEKHREFLPKALLTRALNYGKSKFEKTRTKIKEIQEKRKIESTDEEKNDSKIFVTKSSKDFAKIKADETFIDQQPRCHPIIGACVIAIPYALKQAGLPMGLFLLLAVSIMVEYSEVLLIQCSLLAKETCLQNISKKLFGTPGFVISYTIPYLYSLSVLLTYNVILADTCTKLAQSLLQALGSHVTLNRKVILLLLTIIIIPISMTTNVKRIFKWSLVSLISASFVTVLVTVRLFTLSGHVPHTYNAFKFLNTNIIQSVAVMSFALSCQHTCRLYYATIDQSKEFDPDKPASIASSYSLLCTIVLGCCGYLTFRGITQVNILENYCEEDLLATLARISFAGFILCLFPMECQSLRHLIQQGVVVHRKFQNIFHFSITLFVLTPALLGAMLIDCLSIVLETAGLMLAVPLIFILPSIFFVRLSAGKLYSATKLPCLISIATGFTISVCGLTMTLFTNHYCIHQSHMFPYCNGSSELLGPLITLMSLNGSVNFDPATIGFNLTSFDTEYENLTDIAAAYFTT